MRELDSLVDALIILIRLGVACRFVYICVGTIIQSDTFEDSKKKLLFLMGCYVICENIVLLKNLFLKYYI